MKATREQCLAMAKRAEQGMDAGEIQVSLSDEGVEHLVHLAQQFTLDQLRAQGGVLIWTKVPAEMYYRIPETLE